VPLLVYKKRNDDRKGRKRRDGYKDMKALKERKKEIICMSCCVGHMLVLM
jgi:hypothetical protein